MAQFQAINPNVQVNGQTVLSFVEGLGAMKQLGLKILSENGITEPASDKWYPQQSWLNAFRQISEKVGPRTLYIIGKSIPENAQFPPDIDNIEKALASIDVAYHMNHSLHGKPLFNQQTGNMQEGIGHYSFKKTGDNQAEIVCDNPYPCDFDKGIIDAMAHKFKPANAFVKTTHEESEGCRKKGQNSCRYVVKW
jgi:hypothetical protein